MGAASGTFDLIYNRLIAEQKLSSANAYERLAAVVFFLLHDQTTVQDLRLIGASKVKHQIDVTVGEPGSSQQRVLIECKDYGKPIGLPMVRNFFGVVEDVRPDEAFMITTRRFTKPAQKYAAAKNIRLAILRPVEHADLDGRIQRIVITLNATMAVGDPTVAWVALEDPPTGFPQGTSIRTERLTLRDQTGAERPAQPDIESAIGTDVPLGASGDYEGNVEFDEPTWLCVDGGHELRVAGFNWRQSWQTSADTIEIGEGIGGLSAELVLRSLDGSIDEIFSNRTLSRWTIDAEGRVVSKEPAADTAW